MAKKINRKDFIKASVLTGIGASTLLSSCANKKIESTFEDSSTSSKKYKWKMVTTWPPNFPVVGEGASLFAKWVEEMSGGRVIIKVFGSGELVPAFEVFDAVSSGAAEMGSGASYYWAGKNPIMPIFTGLPFGMNAQQMNSWLYCGGGLELYRELYAKYNLVPFPGGNTGVQMGGWYNKEINGIEDYKGLKIRMPGLGAKVIEKVGGTPVLSPGSEIYTNLERGVIDATEWIGPYHDYKMGFQDISKYYYAPGWHEPGSNLELIIDKRLYDDLPKDIQAILEAAAYRLNMWVLSEFESKNNEYLKKILEESDVELRTFSKDVLSKLQEATNEVLDELASTNEECKKIYSSYKSFQDNIKEWAKYSEGYYHEILKK